MLLSANVYFEGSLYSISLVNVSARAYSLSMGESVPRRGIIVCGNPVVSKRLSCLCHIVNDNTSPFSAWLLLRVIKLRPCFLATPTYPFFFKWIQLPSLPGPKCIVIEFRFRIPKIYFIFKFIFFVIQFCALRLSFLLCFLSLFTVVIPWLLFAVPIASPIIRY